MTQSILAKFSIIFLYAIISNFAIADNFGGTGTGQADNAAPKKDKPDCNADAGGADRSPFSILFVDGREVHRITDMVVKGTYPLTLSRKYDSQAEYDSTLGYGWAFSFDRKLYAYPDGSVLIRSECGRRDKFIQASGAFVTPAGSKRGTLTLKVDGSYEFLYVSGNRDLYNQQGQLITIQNSNGFKRVLTYDTRGRLPITGTSPYSVDPTKPMVVARLDRLLRIEVQFADNTSTGQFIDFAYNDITGRVTTATDNTGRIVTYTHDITVNNLTKGNLESVATPTLTYTYKYEDPLDNHNVTQIIRGLGATPQVLAYNALDQVHKETIGNKILDIVINGNLTTTTTTTVTDENGLNPRTYIEQYEFYVDDYIKSHTNALGHKTIFTYDPGHKRLIKKVLWEKTTTGLALFSTIDYTYFPNGNRKSKVIQPTAGETITWTWLYNQNRLKETKVVSSLVPTEVFQTNYTYYVDANGVPTQLKTTEQRDFDATVLITKYLYDTQGRLKTITAPDGITEQILNYYPANGRLKNVSYGNAGVAIPDKSITVNYDAKGNIDRIWDAKNNLTGLVFNNINNLTQITNAKNEITIAGYDARDNINKIEYGRVGTVAGRFIKLFYNGQNELTSVIKINDQNIDIVQWELFYDSEGNRVKVVDAENNATLYEYNFLNQLTKVTDAKLNITQFKYDAGGNRTKTTDAKLNVTDYTYDKLNRLTATIQRGVTPNLTTKFSYNAIGQIRTVTDPKTNIIAYEYDGFGRLKAEVKTLGQRLSYTYDANSRLKTKTNSRQQFIRYDYEIWGGLKLSAFFKNTADTVATYAQNFGYDLEGNLTTLNDSRIQAADLYTNTHDVLNRLKTQDIAYIPGGTRQLQYGYDEVGNRNSLILVDGITSYTHSFKYNKLNQLNNATLPNNQLYTLSYYANENLKQLKYPNGIVTDTLYELNNDIQQIKVSNAANVIMEQFDYVPDAVGNIKSITQLSGQQLITYDGINRLTSLTQPLGSPIANESYGYDELSNRELPSDPLAYDYDSNNRIIKSPTLSYTFDDDGNLSTRSDGFGYNYDIDNRLKSLSQTSTALNASYSYDPTGRRISKTVNSITTWYLWDGDAVIAEYDGTGAWQKRYSYLPQYYTPVQMQDAAAPVAVTNGVYFVHLDHLGSPRLISANNVAQDIVWRWNSDSFGSTLPLEDVDGDGVKVSFNFRFAGQYFDSESGLHYNYFRYYDPKTGRYITSDPIGLNGGLNTYIYVDSDPLNWIDPPGLGKRRSGNRNKAQETFNSMQARMLIRKIQRYDPSFTNVTARAKGRGYTQREVNKLRRTHENLKNRGSCPKPKQVRKQVFQQFRSEKEATEAVLNSHAGPYIKPGSFRPRSEKHSKGSRHLHDGNHNNLTKPNIHYGFPG